MKSKTRERPILFSGPMVRAILEGRKTQTRRAVKPRDPTWTYSCVDDADGQAWLYESDDVGEWHEAACPYGEPGDRLWVRETWRCTGGADRKGIIYRADEGGRIPDAFALLGLDELGRKWLDHGQWPDWDRLVYDTAQSTTWRPSIHMPRWASRINLKVMGVRIERVQEISEEDAQAEGVDAADDYPGYCPECHGYGVTGCCCDYSQDCVTCATAKGRFSALWDSINAKRGFSWNTNPWVWVISFRRTED